MPKTLKLFLIALLLSTSLFSTSSSAASFAFSPQRSGVALYGNSCSSESDCGDFRTCTPDGCTHTGFNYPTYNNFTGNPNIQNTRDGDERTFLVGKYCADGNCPSGDPTLYKDDISSTPLKAGDVVRMQIYFHNNGADPYDGQAPDSENARNVKVGVELNNNTPTGFIYADNNEYRTNPSVPTTVLKDTNGQIIRTATDGMSLSMAGQNLKLKPIVNSSFLNMQLGRAGQANQFDDYIKQNTNIAFNVSGPDNYSTSVTPHTENNKIWLEFSELPGCFHYSGFAYFDFVVEAEETIPACQNISAGFSSTGENIGNLPLQKLEVTGINFSTQTPDGISYKWTTTDPNGKFYKKNLTTPGYTEVGNSTETLVKIVYYTGSGNISVQPADSGILGERNINFNLPACTANFSLPAAPNFCTELTANYSETSQLVNGKRLRKLTVNNVQFSVNKPDALGYEWTGTDPNGKFYQKNLLDSGYSIITPQTQNSRTVQTLVNLVYYDGSGNVSVKLIDPGIIDRNESIDLNPKVCVADIGIPNAQNNCTTFNAGQEEEFSTTINGKSVYLQKFRFDNSSLSFSGGIIPTNTGLLWKTDNANGKFYNRQGNTYMEQGNSYLSSNRNEPVFYSGYGHVSVRLAQIGSNGREVLPIPDYLEANYCRADFDISPKCYYLDTSFTSPITLNQVSKLSSIAYMVGGGNFPEKINYSVEPDYGTFFYEKPADIAENTNPLSSENTLKNGTFFRQQVMNNQIDGREIINMVNSVASGNNSIINNNAEFQNSVFNLPLQNIQSQNAEIQNANNEDSTANRQAALANGFNTVSATANSEVYFVAKQGGNNVIHVKAENTDQPACGLDLNIPTPGEELSCQDLNVSILEITDPTSRPMQTTPVLNNKLKPGTEYIIRANATYNQNIAGPKTLFKSTQGVFLRNGLPTPIAEFPDGTDLIFITFANASGNNILTIQASGRNETACSKSYDIEASQTASCKNLDLEVRNLSNNSIITGNLEANSSYQLKATTTYSPSIQNPGANFSTSEGILYPAGSTGTVSQTLNNIPNSQAVILTTPVTTTGSGQLRVTASPQSNNNPGCTITRPINASTTPPNETKCLDLNITNPSGTWTADDFSNGDEQNFSINVTTAPGGSSNNLQYVWRVSPSSAGNWRNGSVTNGGLSNRLENIDDQNLNEVEIYAIDQNGTRISACSDSISFNEENRPSGNEPRIHKFVFDPESLRNKWRTQLSIAGLANWARSENEYINYRIDYDSGSEAKAKILDKSLSSGNIESKESINGSLDLSGLLIADTKKKEIIYQENFNNNNNIGSELIEGIKLSAYRNYSDKNADDYIDHYDCDEPGNSNKLCIKDIKDLFDEFAKGSRGKGIQLENLDDQKIVVIYQMRNQSKISNNSCLQLQQESGCGESFENEASYEAGKYDGADKTNVRAICPFVITRSGGDTFFNNQSGINTGIGLRSCTIYDNTVGPILRPIPVENKVPSTGAGNEPEPLLAAPTHDVCKLSNPYNNPDNISLPPEFQDLLKNFTSSICQMKAEIAQQWTKDYINSSIKDSVAKITRSITSLTSSSIGSTNTLIAPSGIIYKKDGKLEIKANGDFKIKAGPLIPAAQTYIVQNGNLLISSNIKYDDSNSQVFNPGSIPSAAFIVIDGNIEIDPSVTEIDGIIIALDTDGQGNDGRILEKGNQTNFTNRLTIRGSLIGNIAQLFANRRAIGDPTRDEGSITIRYDERILLNTPPGLQNILDISQLKIAN